MQSTSKRTLLAIACAAVAVSGCATGTYSYHGRDSAQGPRQNSEQTLAASRDPDSDSYVGNVPPGLQTGSKSAASRSDTNGTATSTVVMPASTVVSPAATTTTTSTVLVPVSPSTTTATVLVPATPVPATSVPASVVVASDIDFMNSAAQFNATEIQLSQIAAQRAQSAEVRNFARDTIAAHQRMAGELDGMLRNRSVAVPFSPSPAGNAAVARLAGLSGWDVDRYYLDQVIADHQAASTLYGAESSQAVDVTVRSTAGGDAVTVRDRLNRATDLRTEID
jgi:putative membrane protein